MPNTRPQLGIGSLPQGRDNYRACLYFHTSVNISAEDVHKKGLAEVSRIEKLIKKVKRNCYSNHYTNHYAQCMYIYMARLSCLECSNFIKSSNTIVYVMQF